ncbi:MAG TPA: DUF4430 domain-containing protein [Solirubrobacterales bacterium]|nr:DUF4430 domain-containing protein [Solirubrobacterales bacterium]
MIGRRSTAVAAALLLAALAAAGCGLGPGADVADVELTVTHEFGSEAVLEAKVGGVSESDTVMRVLEGEAEIGTRYGGGFVQSIDGVEAEQGGGRSHDWFFFVNGVESPIGAAEFELEGGERIWWDYRDWTAASRVPAVVGSWPAPLRGGYGGHAHPVVLQCEGGGPACAIARKALAAAGVELASGTPAGAIRVLVGPWQRLRSESAAALLAAGPAESGVYAEFDGSGAATRLRGLDPDADPAREFGPDAGLVAAMRRFESPPTWLVTGVTPAAVRAAAKALDAATLRDHYAVAIEDGQATPLPVDPGAGG